MNLILKTNVRGHYLQVMDRFDESLFNALKPVGVKMIVTQFTGSKTGDTVVLEFTSPIKAKWISKITDHGHDEDQAYFVDEGTQLPFPLKSWTHKHIVQRVDDERSIIVDDMTFSTGSSIVDYLLYPFMYIGFYPRKSSYKKYFN